MENLQSLPPSHENQKPYETTRLDKTILPLREYCRQRDWPRLPQFNYWINSRHPIALACIRRLGGRYFVDTVALEKFVNDATLWEKI